MGRSRRRICRKLFGRIRVARYYEWKRTSRRNSTITCHTRQSRSISISATSTVTTVLTASILEYGQWRSGLAWVSRSTGSSRSSHTVWDTEYLSDAVRWLELFSIESFEVDVHPSMSHHQTRNGHYPTRKTKVSLHLQIRQTRLRVESQRSGMRRLRHRATNATRRSGSLTRQRSARRLLQRYDGLRQLLRTRRKPRTTGSRRQAAVSNRKQKHWNRKWRSRRTSAKYQKTSRRIDERRRQTFDHQYLYVGTQIIVFIVIYVTVIACSSLTLLLV